MLESRICHVLSQLSPLDDHRPDAELLREFLTHREERAFVTLIVRHTPGIRAVSRGWLNSSADIDDVTQATFLVHLNRAGTIRDPAAIGSWLYRTAGFIARKLKHQSKRQSSLPDFLAARVEPDDRLESTEIEQEIARLPEPYRLAIQLHYQAGLTAAAAAERLGCPRATILTRLARGRQILHRRLLARGYSSAIVIAPVTAMLSDSPSWASALAQLSLRRLLGASNKVCLFSIVLSPFPME